MTESSNRFAQWLNATMQSRGLSQADVARGVGVADAQVSRWRRGQVRPSVGYLQRIADTFGVPRVSLDLLAGYPVSGTEVATVETDPELEAELQAYQARFRGTLEQLPPGLWAAYTRACEALARELGASFSQALAAVEQDVRGARGEEKTDRPIGFRSRGPNHEDTP